MEMVTDPHLVNTPNKTTTFVHFLDSTTTEMGSQSGHLSRQATHDSRPFGPA
jgi:hypothetical protein